MRRTSTISCGQDSVHAITINDQPVAEDEEGSPERGKPMAKMKKSRSEPSDMTKQGRMSRRTRAPHTSQAAASAQPPQSTAYPTENGGPRGRKMSGPRLSVDDFYRFQSAAPTQPTQPRPRSMSLYPSSPDLDHPNYINFSTIQRDLGVMAREKGGISFNAIGFILERQQKIHNRITSMRPDVEQAVLDEDVTSLKTLCSQDDGALAVAAFAAVREDKADILDSVLDMCVAVDPEKLTDRPEGDGLLHVAVDLDSPRCCQLLLERGFSPTRWNAADAMTPLHFAAANGNVDLLRMLADTLPNSELNVGDDRDGQSVLHTAVNKHALDVVKELLFRRVNKLGRSAFAETALHTASECNSHECALLLLEDGILVDAMRGDERETALHIAARNGYAETVHLLLKYNADPNAKNARDCTPLHLASETHSCAVMRSLIDHGADVDSVDREGRPPLHFAINSKMNGATEAMQLLIDHNADINMADVNGNTALHLAAVSKKMTRVNLLIRGGADVCTRNRAGKSALHFVMKHVPNSLRTIEERMDAGIRPDSVFESDTEKTTVKLNFNFLLPAKSRHPCVPVTSEVGLYMEVLRLHNNDPPKLARILMHPLSLSYLHLKWEQVKWLYYILILFSHLVYALTYSTYCVLVFNELCPPEDVDLPADYNDRLLYNTTCETRDDAGRMHTSMIMAIVAWIFLIVFNFIYVAKEMTKLLHLGAWRYVREWESFLNVVTIATFPFISFHTDPFDPDPKRPIVFVSWQFHIAGVGVLITWILQMFLIGKVPRFGKYVQMLLTVGTSFLTFFVAYGSLLLGFALSFSILFPREVSFRQALTSPIKVLVMLTGEIDYNSLYYQQKETVNLTSDGAGGFVGTLEQETQKQFFPFTAHLLLSAFIVIASIVVMNLLFGMAVQDVQELYKRSRLSQSIQQVQLISYMESILFSPLFARFPAVVQRYLKSKLHGLEGRNVWEFEPDSYDTKKRFPLHITKSIKEKCNELSKRRGDDPGHPSLRGLAASVARLDIKMEELQLLLSRVLPHLDISPQSDTVSDNLSFRLEAACDDSAVALDVAGISPAPSLRTLPDIREADEE